MKRQAFGLLISLTLLTPAALAQHSIDWYTIDGGGAMYTSGGGFELSGTIGQPDAGSFASPMTGGGFELVGGFWAVAAAAACPGNPGDANCDGAIDFFDIDPFLMALFDPGTYASTFCGGSICAVDANCDDSINFFDIDPFINCIFSGCPACP